MTEIPSSQVSIRRVLAATDFSPLSQRALRHAISIARHHAKFYIVHVVSSWGFTVAGYNTAVEASKLAQADLEKMASELIKERRIDGQGRGSRNCSCDRGFLGRTKEYPDKL